MALCGEYYFNFFYFVSVLVFAVITDPSKTLSAAEDQDILADYYWGSNELRSLMPCDLTIVQIVCVNKCGTNYMCENNECICDEDNNPRKSSFRTPDGKQLYPYQDNQYMYFKEYDFPELLRTAIEEDANPTDTKPVDTKPVDTKLVNTELIPVSADTATEDATVELSEHPALRHHIAHFCPNLTEARKCIRKCMEFGQPAFCGKDHVCYCGHSYTSHDEKKKVNKKENYAEFRDLYLKYFGPQIFEPDNNYSED